VEVQGSLEDRDANKNLVRRYYEEIINPGEVEALAIKTTPSKAAHSTWERA
jgi:hypothetical protein